MTGEIARTERQPRQGADAALWEYHVSMSLWINDAAFVTVNRGECVSEIEGIRGLLDQPPCVFTPGAVVMITVADPIEGSDVNRITPHVLKGSIIASIAADFRVAMELAANGLKLRA